jgi:hypothetical protein
LLLLLLTHSGAHMSDQRHPSMAAAPHGDSKDVIQSDEEQSRHSSPDANAAANAVHASGGNSTSSLLLLHDDELSCVLPFLSLADLVQLVRCGRRFNGVVRKGRNLSLHLQGDAAIVPPLSSALSHHISSLHFRRRDNTAAPVIRDILQQLCALPRLTSLQIMLSCDDDMDHLMRGFLPGNAAAQLRAVLLPGNTAAQLRAVLPTQLRSFSVAAIGSINRANVQIAAFVSSFWAALGDMRQLTELRIEQHCLEMYTRPELAQLPHLRKLTLGTSGERGEHVEALKQLSQLRELTLLDECHQRIRLLCQPPHSLQLESLTLPSVRVDEETMHALLHLPTLTALLSRNLAPDAWPLLPQLPRLRQVSFSLYDPLTPKRLVSLCDSLTSCSALEDLTLLYVFFKSVEGAPLSAEQRQAGWTALLSSVPKLRRLSVHAEVMHVLSALSHVPLLEHLSLDGWADRGVDPFATLAHPNLRVLELGPLSPTTTPPSKARLRSWLQSEQLPKLVRCFRRVV